MIDPKILKETSFQLQGRHKSVTWVQEADIEHNLLNFLGHRSRSVFSAKEPNYGEYQKPEDRD